MLAVREPRLPHAELPLTRKFYFSDHRSGGGITRADPGRRTLCLNHRADAGVIPGFGIELAFTPGLTAEAVKDLMVQAGKITLNCKTALHIC